MQGLNLWLYTHLCNTARPLHDLAALCELTIDYMQWERVICLGVPSSQQKELRTPKRPQLHGLKTTDLFIHQ